MRKRAAAHPGHHAGVALHPARLGVGPRDAGDGAHGDRRRDPRGRRRQARQPPRAVARAARGARAATARCTRIGLSATQKPIEEVARFLVGAARRRRHADCAIVDIGHAAQRDLALECRRSPLEAVMSNEVVGAGLRPPRRAGRASTARRWSSSTRGAWPSASRATSPSGSARSTVAAHHGSLAKEQRLDAEQRLKRGELQGAGRHRVARARHRHRRRRPRLPARLAALDRDVPAARRPLGPRGRRHAQGPAVPAHRATSWSNAPRCSTACAAASSTALRDPASAARRAGAADRRRGRGREWDEDELFALVRRAWPYRDLAREDFDAVVDDAGRRLHARAAAGAARYLHRDAVNRRAARPRAARG